MSSALTQKSFAIRVHDRNAAEIIPALKARFPDMLITEDKLDRSADISILYTFWPPEDEDISSYDWIHSTGAGFDHIARALKGSDKRPIITRTHGTMGRQMGEYCLAYALSHFQKMAERRDLQSQHNWWRKKAAPTHCFDKSVALFGTGEIGRTIAGMFSFMQAAVTGYSRSGKTDPAFDAVFKFGDFVKHQKPFDVVISVLPNTAETRNLLNADVFSAFKGALFINVGRGATVDENALRKALDSGPVGHAVLDVMQTEPLPEDNWLWDHPKVTLSPHVSGLTRTQDAVEALSERIDDALKMSELPDTPYNPGRGY